MLSDATNGSTDATHIALTSISMVVLAERGPIAAASLRACAERLACSCDDVETIVIANGVGDDSFLQLKRTVSEIPDCSCFVFADPVNSDVARLSGMEAAVSDYVILVDGDALAAVMPALPAISRALKEGFDIVAPLPTTDAKPERRPVAERLAYAILSKLSGLQVAQPDTGILALSREACLHILSKPDAALLLRARTAGGGFPVARIANAYRRASDATKTQPFGRRAGAAISLLVSIGAVPLRVVSLISLASSLLSILYALYVVFTYLTKPNVAAGWTTLSLQLAGMMFLFSVMLALLSEYVVQIYAATATRQRRQIVRELRSETTARHGRLNVTDESGRYRLGAPADVPLAGIGDS